MWISRHRYERLCERVDRLESRYSELNDACYVRNEYASWPSNADWNAVKVSTALAALAAYLKIKIDVQTRNYPTVSIKSATV